MMKKSVHIYNFFFARLLAHVSFVEVHEAFQWSENDICGLLDNEELQHYHSIGLDWIRWEL